MSGFRGRAGFKLSPLPPGRRSGCWGSRAAGSPRRGCALARGAASTPATRRLGRARGGREVRGARRGGGVGRARPREARALRPHRAQPRHPADGRGPPRPGAARRPGRPRDRARPSSSTCRGDRHHRHQRQDDGHRAAAHLLGAAGIDAPAGRQHRHRALGARAARARAGVAVVEVSSFQLGIAHLRPDDRRADQPRARPPGLVPDVEAYYADKARLFQNATPESRWVLNGEDERARAAGDAPGERYTSASRRRRTAGERGGYLDADGWLTLRLDGARRSGWLPADELRILGPHNVANALAAALAARSPARRPRHREGLRTFEAPEHRLEPVAEVGGVLWINDSKATNIASTRVAMRSMDRRRAPARRPAQGRAVHRAAPRPGGPGALVVAYGEAARDRADLGGTPVERSTGASRRRARAAELARPGDAVLLSPACSSYDMFRTTRSAAAGSRSSRGRRPDERRRPGRRRRAPRARAARGRGRAIAGAPGAAPPRVGAGALCCSRCCALASAWSSCTAPAPDGAGRGAARRTSTRCASSAASVGRASRGCSSPDRLPPAASGSPGRSSWRGRGCCWWSSSCPGPRRSRRASTARGAGSTWGQPSSRPSSPSSR
jgi:hypothetical protein